MKLLYFLLLLQLLPTTSPSTIGSNSLATWTEVRKALEDSRRELNLQFLEQVCQVLRDPLEKLNRHSRRMFPFLPKFGSASISSGYRFLVKGRNLPICLQT